MHRDTVIALAGGYGMLSTHWGELQRATVQLMQVPPAVPPWWKEAAAAAMLAAVGTLASLVMKELYHTARRRVTNRNPKP